MAATSTRSEDHPDGRKPWIWDHADTASDKYDYQGPEAEPESRPEQPVGPAVEPDSARAEQDSGFQAFIDWVRSFT